MSRLTRILTTDAAFFVTIVTHKRTPILIESSPILRIAIESALRKFEASELAWVILPDHYHGIIRTGNTSISTVVQCLKMSFASRHRLATGMRSGRVWQNRFWDHIIRSERDLRSHLDYIHYNPVKHGYARVPVEYQHSTYNSFLGAGFYPADWGVHVPEFFEVDFGE